MSKTGQRGAERRGDDVRGGRFHEVLRGRREEQQVDVGDLEPCVGEQLLGRRHGEVGGLPVVRHHVPALMPVARSMMPRRWTKPALRRGHASSHSALVVQRDGRCVVTAATRAPMSVLPLPDLSPHLVRGAVGSMADPVPRDRWSHGMGLDEAGQGSPTHVRGWGALDRTGVRWTRRWSLPRAPSRPVCSGAGVSRPGRSCRRDRSRRSRRSGTTSFPAQSTAGCRSGCPARATRPSAG